LMIVIDDMIMRMPMIADEEVDDNSWHDWRQC
jgi:hypothetical protein